MISEILFDNDVVFLPSSLAVSPVKRQSTHGINTLAIGSWVNLPIPSHRNDVS